mgnify:CR=1 FL=1
MLTKCSKEHRDLFVQEINPGAETLERLDAYEAVLTQWQARVNLVGDSTLPALWSRHFLDSAQIYRHLPASAQALTDIGSGGGFPGMVLAILTSMSGGPTVTLIESNGRKAEFLREANRICAAGAKIMNVRVEGAPILPADVVTARACAPLIRLLPWVYRCLRADGVALLSKGLSWRDELTTAEKHWNMGLAEIPSVTDTSGVILKLEGLNPNWLK